ncbi:MAG: hypothetical protein M5U19_04495 [Microthrixaceae bacterium]|nr:hypothetical protein [Microthrixaceae bacterium]
MIEALDSLSDTASRLEAVNCIEWEGERLIGHNTDGDGLLASLRAQGVEPSGSRVVVLGAGGAARAAVLALGGAGAAEVLVLNRSPERGRAAAALVPGARSVSLTGDPGTSPRRWPMRTCSSTPHPWEWPKATPRRCRAKPCIPDSSSAT